MIALRDVHKAYRQGTIEVAALAGVTLEVARGEFVAVVGASGSGKSTMLDLMGGLDLPTRGDVVVAGVALSQLSDDEITVLRRRRIGFVFQFFNLLPTLTAEENVALPLLLDGLAPRAARPRVRAALEGVGLGHRARHRPDELSGGEMQRVAIARALVVDPALILADEPTGNLDSATGARILDAIADAHRAGTTVVMATHDARAAARASRIVTLRDGVVVDDRLA